MTYFLPVFAELSLLEKLCCSRNKQKTLCWIQTHIFFIHSSAGCFLILALVNNVGFHLLYCFQFICHWIKHRFVYSPYYTKGLPRWHRGKGPPVKAGDAGDLGSIPGSGRSPGVGNGNPLNILAWRIPWTEEPGGLQFMVLQRVGHDWTTKHSLYKVWVEDQPLRYHLGTLEKQNFNFFADPQVTGI